MTIKKVLSSSLAGLNFIRVRSGETKKHVDQQDILLKKVELQDTDNYLDIPTFVRQGKVLRLL